MLTKDEAFNLQEIVNEEILSCLRSGTPLDDGYIVSLRSVLQKLGLKETYNYERYKEN